MKVFGFILFGLIFHFNIGVSIAQTKPLLNEIQPYVTRNPDTAFYLTKSLYIQAEKNGDEDLKAKCALLLGEIQFYLGNFELANQYLLEAIEVFEVSGSDEYIARASTWQGIVAQYAKQYSQSLPYYKKAHSLYLKLQDSVKLGEIYGWIGHYYEKTGNADTALLYQYRAMQLLKRKDAPTQSLAKIYDNIGSLYEDKEQYDSARYYFKKALLLNQLDQNINEQIVNINNIGDTYRKTGDLQNALLFVDSAFQLAQKHHLEYQVRSAHRDFSKIYSLLDNPQLSLYHLEKAYNLYTRLLNEEQLRRMSLLQMTYETERKENQISLLEKDKKFNRVLRIILTFVLVGFAIGGVLVVRNQKEKVKQSRKILDQKTQLFEKEKKVNQLEIKNALLNEQHLKSEIENRKMKEDELQENIMLKSQLITSHTLQIIRKNNLFQKLKVDLQQLKRTEKKERHLIVQELIHLINHDITKDENWEDFNIIFSKVHNNFYTDLKSHAPDITPAEMRLSALIKLNLHSQEVATIIGISQDSLRIARYRLKKKLRLDKNDDLATFLMNT